jgi:polyhydroxyalkanoate synthase
MDGLCLASALLLDEALRQDEALQQNRLGLAPQPSPSHVLLATPAMRVRSYPGDGPPRNGSRVPLLLIAAPITRAYIWDLAPQASTVRLLAAAGFAVHLLCGRREAGHVTRRPRTGV